MQLLLLVLPILIVLITLIVIVAHRLGQAWVDHRVKLALLERLEQRPELLAQIEEVIDEVDAHPEQSGRQDLVLTGVFLAVIGILSVVGAGLLGSTLVVVGIYFGGVACVFIGFILATTGLLIRYLSHSPLERVRD